MKTIVWICNTPLPEIQKMLGYKIYNEGWLIGISNQLRKREDVIFHYVFWQDRFKRTIHRMIDGITFWGIYDCHKNSYQVEKDTIQNLSLMFQQINPDVIHVFGTEFSHSLECVYSVPDIRKVIVSIQGLTSEIDRVYLQGIPFMDRVLGKWVENRYWCLLSDRWEFHKRGINEKKVIITVGNVIGRTSWDKKCVKKINPSCKYYHCNETLRETFYVGEWELDKIQRHSIFVSQAYYPIKGLHLLISALPLIMRKYPDVTVYVAGDKSFLSNGNPYGCYIKRILKKYNVAKKIEFLGGLADENVKKRLLKSHIALMPSLIENSPNSIGEAMLLGTPVVAADVGGIRSIMKDGIDGYLYSTMDRKEMAGKICDIFGKDKLALQFSKNGRKHAMELYDKTHNVNQLLSIYENVIKTAKEI